MYFLAEYLQNKGFELNVVHSKGKFYGDFGMPVKFHRIPIGKNSPTDTSHGSSSNPENRIQQITIKNAKFFLQKSNLSFFENLIFNDPNPWMGIIGYLFVRNARNAILKTIKDRAIKFVIISGPPFLLFSIAPVIKKHFPDVKIIFDYRDPWNTMRSPYVSTLLEKKYLRFADRFVFLNDRMLKDSVLKYGLPETRCETVLNGYSIKDWNEVQEEFLDSPRNTMPANNRMVILCIGSGNFGVGGIRDIATFFDSFEIFQKNKKILLRFVGITPSKESEEVKQRFSSNIEIISAVSLHTSFKYMLDSDILILIHTKEETAKYVLTGKLFDYIRSGKVIFGIGKKDTYFLDFIALYKLGLVCDNQSVEILRNLELLYKHWEEGTLNQIRQNVGLNIEDYSRDGQNAKYLKILQSFYLDGK